MLRLLTVALLACACAHEGPAITPNPIDWPQPGDRAAARWGDAFYAATVVTRTGPLVDVAWDQPPPERSAMPAAFLTPLDRPLVGAADHSWVLAERDSDRGAGVYRLCRVEHAAPEGVQVRCSDGALETHALADLRAMPTALASWAGRRGSVLLARAALLSRLPHMRPAAGRVVRGGRVVARWSKGGWWDGVAREVQAGAVKVEWTDGSSESVALASVSPLAPPAELAPGQILFCPQGAQAPLVACTVESTRPGTRQVVMLGDGSHVEVDSTTCTNAQEE
jgi:hypothetical protein